MERPRLTADDEIRLAKRIEAGLLAHARLDDMPAHPFDALGPSPSGGGVGHAAATVEELAFLVRQGVLAKETLTLGNLGLVRVIAAEIGRRTSVNRADLFQEGCLALEHAILRFDYRRGRFGPYAAVWIRTSMRRLADPTVDHLTQEVVDETPVQWIESHVNHLGLSRVLHHLPTEERRVVRLRHGWDGEPASLAQVATRLDLTVSKVRRLERQGLARLRDHWLAAA
jgi:RNA polymerase sigma factor (sigma-70 family)